MKKQFCSIVSYMDYKTLLAAFGGKHYFASKLGIKPSAVLQWQHFGLPKTYARRLVLIAAVEFYEPIDPRLKAVALDFVRDPNN